ncbi:hypothetical protein GF389_01550 [Candidatus Dojkabacteria bacterium]|nr:hypothetical protein [Candidatus Dojkabacteria bacterium]
MELLKNQTIRQYLSGTGLLLEADVTLAKKALVNSYYGINVTKTDKEPIDQIQGLICQKRIQEWNEVNFGNKGKQIIFIGGLFEILNTQNLEALQMIVKKNLKKEQEKRKLFTSIADKFNLRIDVKTTLDLWKDPKYWEILYELIESEIFTRGNLMNDTLKFYNSKEELMNVLRLKEIPKDFINLPIKVLKKIGNWPAPLLYTPVQVAEGFYLKERFRINAKVGQLQERVYDKYLKGQIDTYRLKQSVDLLSTRTKTQIVTPYIDKNKNKAQSRIYFGEKIESITEKITEIEVDKYLFTTDEEYCEVINPIVEKAIYAIESARCQEQVPVMINNTNIYSGGELMNAIEAGKSNIENLKSELPSSISTFVSSLP